VNLGQILLQERAYADAAAAFRTALASEPHSATAVYNLGLALVRSGQAEEGQRLLERFRELRDSGAGTVIGQSYPDQGRYAEALVSTGAEPGLVDERTPDVRFTDASARFLGTAAVAAEQATLADVDGDGDLDLLTAGPSGVSLLRYQDGRFATGVPLPGSGPARGTLVGDLDNDERPDLVIVRGAGASLLRGDGSGFADATAAAGVAMDKDAHRAAALADFDHDGDLDILLAGDGSGGRLLRNAGGASFADAGAAAGLAGSAGRVVAVVPTDYDNGRDMDLLELPDSGRPRLWRNRRDGSFRDVAEAAGLTQEARYRCAAAGDVNQDTRTDFFLGVDGGPSLLALSEGRERFALAPGPAGSQGATAALLVDYDNDGLLDLVAVSPGGARLARNLGARWADVTAAALADEAARLRDGSLAAGDLDGDGDTDLVAAGAAGLRVLENRGADRAGSVSVRLSGRVSNRSGVGAKVEMRAGSLRQRLETYAALPMPAPADVRFGLGGREGPDAVRVLWPSGTLQAELATPGARQAAFQVQELDRKPSSCPYLYAWDGQRFAFVTDFMGGGEMGYLLAPGVYNHPDPVEYVRLDDAQLRPRAGRYELRVTNELEEALFVDRLALLAVAHPDGLELHPQEGMTTPPKPHALLAVKDPRPVAAATDDHGHDVTERVARLDRAYPDDFRRLPIRGYAETHALTLDLGQPPPRAALLLTGWTDYAFSSDNLSAAQAGLAMQPPRLEVEAAAGQWVTAVEQVGIPVGRPQTVVVPLTGLWRGPGRRVRIVTNMRVLWDQARVGELVDASLETRTLEAATAELRERGFSAERSPDGREPFAYDYERVSLASPWKAFPGRYTREGGVRELLAASDDLFVISRPGDALALSFDAAALPPLPPGYRRTFLLFSDGYSKEMDINSATPDALGPLPFHAMTRYPYRAPEAYPMSEERRRIYERYNTRAQAGQWPGLELVTELRARDARAEHGRR
jgi:hypothetical protein